VELQIEIEKMLEGFSRDLADGTLANVGEYCVQEFTGECCPNPCETI
jgi:hypothetical protein